MHILVVRNNSNPQAVDASLLLTAYLTSQGIEALLVDSSSLGTDAGRREVRAQLPGQLALVVVLGGDGTVLHTVHLLHDRQVPILPINFGRLGFLANADTDGVVPLVAEALPATCAPSAAAFSPSRWFAKASTIRTGRRTGPEKAPPGTGPT